MIVPCRLQGFSSVPQLSPIKVIVSVFAEIMSFCSRSGKLRTVRYKTEKNQEIVVENHDIKSCYPGLLCIMYKKYLKMRITLGSVSPTSLTN